MRIILFAIGAVISSLSYGANWVYVTSTGVESFFIDKDFYKYDRKNNTVDVWSKSITKKTLSSEFYTNAKFLERFSCTDKKSKTLAIVIYHENGGVLRSNSQPEYNFSLIFPETIAEGLWKVACDSKGNGFKFTKQRLELLSIMDNLELL